MKPFPWYEFHLNVLEVVESTPNVDTDLRDTILEICVEAVEEITGVTPKNGISAEDWAPVLKEDPDFLLAMLERATRANVCALEEKDRLHRRELAELEEINTRERNRMQAVINNLNDFQTPKRPNAAMSASVLRFPSSRPRLLPRDS